MFSTYVHKFQALSPAFLCFKITNGWLTNFWSILHQTLLRFGNIQVTALDYFRLLPMKAHTAFVDSCSINPQQFLILNDRANIFLTFQLLWRVHNHFNCCLNCLQSLLISSKLTPIHMPDCSNGNISTRCGLAILF